jgi:hypothetical protein
MIENDVGNARRGVYVTFVVNVLLSMDKANHAKIAPNQF